MTLDDKPTISYKKEKPQCLLRFYSILTQGNAQFVTPSGFEPKSSEPESDILSIELWSRYLFWVLSSMLRVKPETWNLKLAQRLLNGSRNGFPVGLAGKLF